MNTAYSGWWCSNGLYKTVQSGPAVTLNSQQVIPQGVNKRLELAQVGCPNSKAMCGYDNTTPLVATEVVSGTALVFALPDVGMTVDNKCTWVAFSTKAGPTFEL